MKKLRNDKVELNLIPMAMNEKELETLQMEVIKLNCDKLLMLLAWFLPVRWERLSGCI